MDRTSQLNVGGNTDFLNMLERSRLESKKISKTNAVTSQLPYDLPPGDIHIGPSDYVEWLTDRKWAYIRMEGTTFDNVPLNIEMKMEVWDSPNSAGVVIDAVRCCKLALDNGLSGALLAPSSYFKKSPPVQYTDEEAPAIVESKGMSYTEEFHLEGVHDNVKQIFNAIKEFVETNNYSLAFNPQKYFIQQQTIYFILLIIFLFSLSLIT